MAKTALTQLQEQIEAVRREAFAAGYAAAMQAVRELAAKAAPDAAAPAGVPRRRRVNAAAAGAQPARLPRQRRPRAAGRTTTRSRPSRAPRPRRGTNARLVEEVLQSNSPRALHPAEIRNALQRDKGVAMAFTSIRHALGQLEGRHVVEQAADRTWRYRSHSDGPAPA